MKISLFILFAWLLNFALVNSAVAENSRSPAVLDPNCNLDIPTTQTVIIDGKSVVIEKSPEQVQKEQCKEIRECIASADDEDLAELKSLEDVACNANLKAVNTRTPSVVVDKNFDGKRKAKEEVESNDRPVAIPAAAATKPK